MSNKKERLPMYRVKSKHNSDVARLIAEINALERALEDRKNELRDIAIADIRRLGLTDVDDSIKLGYPVGTGDDALIYVLTYVKYGIVDSELIQSSSYYKRLCEFADSLRDDAGNLKYPRVFSKEILGDFKIRYPHSKLKIRDYCKPISALRRDIIKGE